MKKKNYLMISLVMLTFFVISFMTNIIGPLIPDMIKGFKLSLTLVALLPFAFFIAYGLVSLPTGILVEKYNEKIIMVAAFTFSLLGSVLLTLFPNYFSAIISLFLIGSGMAMLQVVINPLLRVSGGEEHYAFNSVLAQLIFGSASFMSPLVYSYMALQLVADKDNNPFVSGIFSIVPAELPWISIYFLFAILSVLMIGIVLLFKFPKIELKGDEKSGDLSAHLRLLKRPVVIAYFLGVFCYVGTEQGIANWVSQFLFTYHGYDPQTEGARIIAYFWGLMTAGGVIGLLLLKVLDSRVLLVSFTLLAIISLSAGLFSTGSIALIAFPLVGFFASVMYPVIFSLALNSLKDQHGVFSGILVTGVAGGAVIPLIVGWIGDHWELQSGMLFLYVTLTYILSIGFWANPLVKNKTIQQSRKLKINQ